MKKLSIKKGVQCMACLECVRACSNAYYKEFHPDKAALKIVQRGENYKVFGPWKVYTNVGQALATFESYRACTQHLTHVYQQGHSLAKLAQATR
mgnify:FL=1